jgi:3-methyladenine DNA glycosylase Mpg
LCQAFGIGRADDGLDLCAAGSVIGVFDDGVPAPPDPQVTPRIGIRVGVDTLWRWVA